MLDPTPGSGEELTQKFQLAGTTDIMFIGCGHLENQYVIFWEDIRQLYPGVQSVRRGRVLVALLRDPATQHQIKPHCIRYHPNEVLDVFLSGPSGLALDMSSVAAAEIASIKSPQDTTPKRQEQERSCSFDAASDVIQGTLPSRSNTGRRQEISAATAISPVESLAIVTMAASTGDVIATASSSNFEQSQSTLATITIRSSNNPHTTTPYTCAPQAITTAMISSNAGAPQAILLETTVSASGPQMITTATILFAEGSQTLLPEDLESFNANISSDSTDPSLLQLDMSLMEAAKRGDSIAQCNLGFIYVMGEMYDVAQNFEKAMDWFVMAAKSGSVHAACNIGVMFQNGIGVEQNYKRAMEWYMKVASPGFFKLWFSKPTCPAIARAQFHVGMLYYFGHGVSKDLVKAAEWILKAATQGNAEAQNALGFLYSVGEGVPQDFKKAVEWYLKAAAQENAYAQSNMGALYAVGNGVAQDDCEAVEWFSKAAVQGVVTAQSNLGSLYVNESGILHNYNKAAGWFTKAADKNDAFSQRELGVLYSKGKGVPQDNHMALELYTKSANQGYADAQNDLGFVFATGSLGITQNDALACQWYSRAANQGHAIARQELYLMYADGRAAAPKDNFHDATWHLTVAKNNTCDTKRPGSGWFRDGKGDVKEKRHSLNIRQAGRQPGFKSH